MAATFLMFAFTSGTRGSSSAFRPICKPSLFLLQSRSNDKMSFAGPAKDKAILGAHFLDFYLYTLVLAAYFSFICNVHFTGSPLQNVNGKK